MTPTVGLPRGSRAPRLPDGWVCQPPRRLVAVWVLALLLGAGDIAVSLASGAGHEPAPAIRALAALVRAAEREGLTVPPGSVSGGEVVALVGSYRDGAWQLDVLVRGEGSRAAPVSVLEPAGSTVPLLGGAEHVPAGLPAATLVTLLSRLPAVPVGGVGSVSLTGPGPRLTICASARATGGEGSCASLTASIPAVRQAAATLSVSPAGGALSVTAAPVTARRS